MSSTKSKRRSSQQPSVSPSVSKTKFRRATITGSERKETKALKTYGSKASRDISEFRGSSDGGQDIYCSRSSGSVIGSRDTEEPQGNVESKKCTRDTAQCEKLSYYKAELPKNADNTNLHLSTESRQNETSPAASLRSSMLPPTLKPFVETHTQRPESSTASTVPFDIPPKLTQIEDAGSSRFSASNDRMPTPTVSFKSRSDAEKPLDSSQSSAKSKNGSSAQVDVSSPRFEKHAELENSDSLPPSKRTRTEDVSGVLSSAEQHQKLQEDAIRREGLPIFASRIDSLVHSLPFTTDRVAIATALEECGGNMDLAASRLLDAEEQGGGHDELSLSASIPAMGSARTRSSKSYKKRELEGKQHTDELGSEEIEIGFPKERYQPRPSRSRSGHGEADDLIIPVDFSKRPEALVKSKKSKRRKTTALAKATPKYEEEDEEEVTPLFSVPKSIKHVDLEMKTRPDSANLANTELPWADPKAQGGHEVIQTANLPASKKQRGRPHKKSTEPRETFSEERPVIDHEDEEPDAEMTEDPLAKAISEAPKPSAPKKQRGRPLKKATGSPEEISEEQLFADEHEEEPDEDLGKDLQENQGDHGVVSAAKTPVAKKQRGRPKKKPAKSLEDIPSDNDDNVEPPEPSKTPSTKSPRKRKKPTLEDPPVIDNDDDEDPPPLLNKSSHPNPLSETQANTTPVPTTTTTDNPSPPPTPSTKHPQQPETPHKPSNVSQQKGPDKHSPLQSGKVRYRVGLSKRARIEPLLRVVRK